MTLSPEARRQLAAGAMARRELWDGQRPMVAPKAPTMIADAALLDIGWQVWSSTRRRVDDPLGGFIVEVVGDEAVDPDTGEVIDRLRWRVRDPYRPGVVQVLTSAEVDLDGGVKRPNKSAVVTMIRRLCLAVGQRDQRWLTATELDALADVHRLLAVVAL